MASGRARHARVPQCRRRFYRVGNKGTVRRMVVQPFSLLTPPRSGQSHRASSNGLGDRFALLALRRALAAGNVSLAEAAALCFAEASAIAARLDARNGTTTFADQLSDLEATIAKAVEKLTPRDR
jgi:hypothetical protein